MTAVILFATILTPIVSALVEVVKKAVNVPNTLIPLIALLIGVLLGFVSTPFTDFDHVLRLWAGGLAGLAATGLFELVKQRDGESKEAK